MSDVPLVTSASRPQPQDAWRSGLAPAQLP